MSAVAIMFDVAGYGNWAGLGLTAFLLVTVAALLVSGRMRNPQARALVLVAVPLSVFLSVRQSPWLVPIDFVLALVLIGVSASYAGGPGRVLGATISALTMRAGRAITSTEQVPRFAADCVAALVPAAGPDRRRKLLAVARGLGVAVPVVAMLGVLLASADAVFASVFRIPVDLTSMPVHGLLLVAGWLLASHLFVETTQPPLDDVAVEVHPFGPTESALVLGSLVLLYGAFALTQLVTARGGADHVLSTAGLTYADYARTGFFQLVAVVLITLVVLLGLRAGTRPTSGRARIVLIVLGEVVVALTLVIVAVALYRLDLYDQAYGLTMLRLAVSFAAWTLGGLILLVGVAYAGIGGSRRWITAAITVTLVLSVLVFNAIDPEAVVVRRNVALAASTGRFDSAYLDELSDDSLPALADALPALDPVARGQAVIRICRPTRERETGRSTVDRNLSADRAATVRSAICR